MSRFRIKYNAPTVLTFALICVLVQLAGTFSRSFVLNYFAVSGTVSWKSPLDWIRLFTHICGHTSWQHLTANMGLILLLGPMLEEKYGSGRMLIMILGTAVITAVLNNILFDTGLLGASGIVFMMIGLASIVDIRMRELPLTLVLVALIYIGREMVLAFRSDDISQTGHLIGAAAGIAYGYIWRR